MRRSRLALLMAIPAVAAILAARPAMAQDGPDPHEIAMACIAEVTHAAQVCVHHNQIRAEHCVAVIGELIGQGHVEAAHHVAAVCIGQIRHESHACTHFIQVRTAVCALHLFILGAPELAHAVLEAGAMRIHAVQASKVHAIMAILDALPDDGGGDGVSVGGVRAATSGG